LHRLWAESAMFVSPRRDKRIAINGVRSLPTLVALMEVAMLPGHRRDLCEENSPLTHTAFALPGLTARPMKHRALQCVHRPGRWAVVVAEAAARWRRVVRHGTHPRGAILHPLAALVLALWACTIAAGAAPARPHNVILFVPDGLRALSVTPDSAPTMAAVRDQGVHFKNAHALFPTFTTANASALATGHHLGDTGDYSNTIYVGYPIASAAGSVTPTLSNNRVPRDLDQHFGGDGRDPNFPVDV